MVKYLENSEVMANIKSARLANETIRYWKEILSLYFPVSEGFNLTHIESVETSVILTCKPANHPQYDLRCVVMVSAEGVNHANWIVEDSDACQYLTALGPHHKEIEAVGIHASGPKFMFFKVSGEELRILNSQPMDLQKQDIGETLEDKLHTIKEAALGGKCKLISKTPRGIDPQSRPYGMHPAESSTLLPTTEFTTVCHQRRSVSSPYRYLTPARNAGLIAKANVSIQDSINCWRAVLESYIGSRGEEIMHSVYVVKKVQPIVFGLDYTDKRTVGRQSVTQTTCLILVVILDLDHPQWDVSKTKAHEFLMKQFRASTCNAYHGIAASGSHFEFFEAFWDHNICRYKKNSSVPLDLRTLDEAMRKEFDTKIDRIVNGDLRNSHKGTVIAHSDLAIKEAQNQAPSYGARTAKETKQSNTSNVTRRSGPASTKDPSQSRQ